VNPITLMILPTSISCKTLLGVTEPTFLAIYPWMLDGAGDGVPRPALAHLEWASGVEAGVGAAGKLGVRIRCTMGRSCGSGDGERRFGVSAPSTSPSLSVSVSESE
jgi:hypothetical protein